LKKKLSCAGARADCSTRGGVGAGRANTGWLAARGAEALGASWIDIFWVSLGMAQATVGHKRENHGGD